MARMSSHPVAHDLGDGVPVTMPLPRTSHMRWGGDEDIVQVPAGLLLAVRGRCSCEDCVDGFVNLLRRQRLHAV